MAKPINLIGVSFSSVEVTERTTWTFAEFYDREGAKELVEITWRNDARRVGDLLVQSLSTLVGQDIVDESAIEPMLAFDPNELQTNQSLAAAVSALRTSIVGLQAKHEGISLTEALGGVPQSSVPLYANINRCLLGKIRTPESFADAASRAVADGFTVIKCAPFDDLREKPGPREILAVAKPGIDRVVAVREAVGPQIQVLVDCQSRFRRDTAPIISHEFAKLDVGWFEEPMEPADDPEGLVQVARTATMPTAGGESGYGQKFFDRLVSCGALAVIMPDSKFCGGVAEAYRCGVSASQHGARVSLHSPSGPVSQLASAHVTAAVPGSMPLEHAVYEASWRSELMSPPEKIEGGRFWFPGGTGSGAALNAEIISRYGTTWKG